jgi:hypothetical protein
MLPIIGLRYNSQLKVILFKIVNQQVKIIIITSETLRKAITI